jgi:hypothetical protein
VGEDYFVRFDESTSETYLVDDNGDKLFSNKLYSGFWELLENNKLEVKKATVKHLPTLLEYLKQHSIVASFNSVSGMIECEAVYSANGESFTVLEEVEPTLKDVCMWLGY